MKKFYSLFACLAIGSLLSASAQSVITPSYYYNDFSNSSANNGTLSYANTSTAIWDTDEDLLKINLSNVNQYNNVLTVTFASPLDLSGDATITIITNLENLTGNDDNPAKPNFRLNLYDGANACTTDAWQYYYSSETYKTSKVINFSLFAGSVDLTNVTKMSIVAQNGASFPLKSGYICLKSISLGKAPTKSVLTATSFENDFSGNSMSDNNQTTSFSSVTGMQSGGILDIYAASGLSTWKDFYTVVFTSPLDLSNAANRKIALKLAIEDLIATGARLGLRVYNGGSKNIFIEPNFSAGTSDNTYSTGWYTDSNFADADWSNITKFVVCTRGTALTAGHLKLDYLKIGGDVGTGIKETELAGSIYVTGNQLQVSPELSGAKIAVYSASGSLYANSQGNPVNLVPGIYIVKIATANGITVQKIIAK